MGPSQADMADLCERMLDIFSKKLDVERKKLQISTRIEADLAAGDLDFTGINRAIEKEFQIEILHPSDGVFITLGDSIKHVGSVLCFPGIVEYIDQREFDELGEAKVAELRAERARENAWAKEYEEAGFFKKLWMSRRWL